MRGGVLLDPKTGRPADERPLEDALRVRGFDSVADYLEAARREPDLRAMTRNKSYIGGRPAAGTAATARVAAANLWNPAAAARIFVYEVWICNQGGTVANISIARTTARGTASTTVTPTADNAIERDVAPPSGFVLDLAWSVAPTIAAGDLVRWNLAAAAGNGVVLVFPDPISLPPGTGLAVITPTAVIFPVSDFTYAVGD